MQQQLASVLRVAFLILSGIDQLDSGWNLDNYTQGSRYRSQISQIAKEKKMWRKKYAFGDTKWRLKKSLAKDTFSR